MPAREVAQIASQILATLAAAHAHGIIHRDIKPLNLFLTFAGDAKILDFGIARMHGPNGEGATQTGRMMGTPAYMPPEQALGLANEIDGRTDLWALGATMFTLLSGRHVHPGATQESVLVHTATRPAPLLGSVAPDVPVPLLGVVDRALAFAKQDRHRHAGAMLAALTQAYAAAFGEPLPRLSARPIGEVDTPAASMDHTMLLVASVPAASPASATPPALSTTSGVSSEYARARAAQGPPPVSTPMADRRRVAVVLAGAVVAFAAMTGVAVVARRAHPSSAASTASEAVGAVPTSAAVPSEASTAVSEPLEASAPGGSGAPTAKVMAPARPSGKVPRDVSPARMGATEPDCNPPVYYDPVTGKKKVKPGC